MDTGLKYLIQTQKYEIIQKNMYTCFDGSVHLCMCAFFFVSSMVSLCDTWIY